MDYNKTAVNSISNMYPTAYLSNSRKSASFSSIVELNISLSTQVEQWLKKQASFTRYRYIFQAKDITRTYRNKSRSSSQTDSEGCLDVSAASSIGAICGMIPSYHGNTSADVTNNQTQRIQINFYSLRYGIMQLLSRNISKLKKLIYIYKYIYTYIYIYIYNSNFVLSLMSSYSLRPYIYIIIITV